MGVGAPYEALRERVRGLDGVVMVIGDAETGKTTLARLLLRDAVEHGRTVAFVDGDVAAATVGPVGCVGLKFVASIDECDLLAYPDELRFVGAVEPSGVVLPHVVRCRGPDVEVPPRGTRPAGIGDSHQTRR